jgi:hypothetical protein
MRCEYDDGFRVEYSGSLRITKGDDVDIYVKESFMPGCVKSNLESAVLHNSCGQLRYAAQDATDSIRHAWRR